MKPNRMFFQFILAGVLTFASWPVAKPVVAHSLESNLAHLTAILVLDNSGSMKASDPENLRYTALDLLTTLLDDDDQLGVIGFSTASQTLTTGLISPRQYKSTRPIPPDGYTDIKSALTEASILLAQANPENKTGVILLTDGKPEIEHPYPEYEQETLALARSLGVPVYAIALTPKADLSFLKRLAAETGGAIFPANNASDLLDVYLQAFNAIQDRTVIGEGIASAPGSVSLEIDLALAPYVEKVSFVLGKPENIRARLAAPDGQMISSTTPNVTFTSDSRFLVVTVKQPQGGTWKFVTEGSGQVRARAILYSRLRVQIVSPDGFQKLDEPTPIIARLVEQRENGEMLKIIGEAAFSAQIIRPNGALESLDRLYDDGTHGDLVANDGDFTRLYASATEPGTYRILVTGHKGAVPVTYETRAEVAAFPILLADSPQGMYKILSQSILLKAHLEGGRLDSGEVLARVTAPSGRESAILLADRDGAYAGEFVPAENGLHTVQFETRAAAFLDVPFWEVTQAQFTVDLIRSMSIGPPEISMAAGCFDASMQVSVRLPVTSLREEALGLMLAGFTLQPDSFSLQPGEQQIVFELFPVDGEFASGDTHVNLHLSAAQEVDLQPAADIPLNFSLPSRWVRCRQPLTWSGLGLFAMVIAGVLITWRRRANSVPALVSGTLRWWAEGQSATAALERDLTGIGRPTLALGSKADCDLCIPNGDLAERHALLLAEKSENGVKVFLQPVATVKKGYGLLHTRIPLTHGDLFCMGGLNFQYLSDSGE